MITFVIIGRNTNRQFQALNLLAASAFLIILIYGPLILFDIGFQLSFFAIIGITFLYAPILNLIKIENKLLYEIWRIAGVSIAATIGTLPFALYYFHRFSVYFILSNIIAVPLSILTIYSGILLIILSPVPLINSVINKITTFLLSCLDGYINRINQLPFSSIHLSYFPLIDLILLLLIIAFVYLFLKQRRTLFLQLSLFSISIMCLVSVFNDMNQRNQHSFTVFSFPGTNAFEFKNNNQSEFISDSSALTNVKTKKYLQDYWDNASPENISCSILPNPGKSMLTEGSPVFQSDNYFQIDSVRCALINEGLPVNIPEKKLAVNYLLLINSPDIKIDDLQKFYSFNKIIFGSSNKSNKMQNWISDCNRLKIPFYSVHDNGAFRLVW
jgi:competence protein ComEC